MSNSVSSELNRNHLESVDVNFTRCTGRQAFPLFRSYMNSEEEVSPPSALSLLPCLTRLMTVSSLLPRCRASGSTSWVHSLRKKGSASTNSSLCLSPARSATPHEIFLWKPPAYELRDYYAHNGGGEALCFRSLRGPILVRVKLMGIHAKTRFFQTAWRGLKNNPRFSGRSNDS